MGSALWKNTEAENSLAGKKNKGLAENKVGKIAEIVLGADVNTADKTL